MPGPCAGQPRLERSEAKDGDDRHMAGGTWAGGPWGAAHGRAAHGRAAHGRAKRRHSSERLCPRPDVFGFTPAASVSVPIMIRLVRAGHRHADIRRLLVGELGEFDADLLEMQSRDLLVELF